LKRIIIKKTKKIIDTSVFVREALTLVASLTPKSMEIKLTKSSPNFFPLDALQSSREWLCL